MCAQNNCSPKRCKGEHKAMTKEIHPPTKAAIELRETMSGRSVRLSIRHKPTKYTEATANNESAITGSHRSLTSHVSAHGQATHTHATSTLEPQQPKSRGRTRY